MVNSKYARTLGFTEGADDTKTKLTHTQARLILKEGVKYLIKYDTLYEAQEAMKKEDVKLYNAWVVWGDVWTAEQWKKEVKKNAN